MFLEVGSLYPLINQKKLLTKGKHYIKYIFVLLICFNAALLALALKTALRSSLSLIYIHMYDHRAPRPQVEDPSLKDRPPAGARGEFLLYVGYSCFNIVKQ